VVIQAVETKPTFLRCNYNKLVPRRPFSIVSSLSLFHFPIELLIKERKVVLYLVLVQVQVSSSLLTKVTTTMASSFSSGASDWWTPKQYHQIKHRPTRTAAYRFLSILDVDSSSYDPIITQIKNNNDNHNTNNQTRIDDDDVSPTTWTTNDTHPHVDYNTKKHMIDSYLDWKTLPLRLERLCQDIRNWVSLDCYQMLLSCTTVSVSIKIKIWSGYCCFLFFSFPYILCFIGLPVFSLSVSLLQTNRL
jgi:hypothetical protein